MKRQSYQREGGKSIKVYSIEDYFAYLQLSKLGMDICLYY